MTDTDIDKQLLSGLRENMNDMREQERRLFKAKGLREHVATLDVELADMREKETGTKKEVGALVETKNDAVRQLSNKMTGNMADILESIGKPVIEMPDNGGLFLGVEKPDGKRVHGQALSGGERVVFDAALSYAMTRGQDGDAVLIVEAAEADADRLNAILGVFQEKTPGAQIIINSWHDCDGWIAGRDENIEVVNLSDDGSEVPDDISVKPIEGSEDG